MITSRQIKDWRVVSISSLIFISYILYDFLQWVQASPPESIGEGVAITGISGSIVGIYKVVFDFAVANSNN